MKLFEHNVGALQAHWPALYSKTKNCPFWGRVAPLRVAEGVTYGLRAGNGWQPLFDLRPRLDLLLARMEQQAAHLENMERPVLVLGLAPGDELLYLFAKGEQQPPASPRPPIRICLNSLADFIGFLQTYDARALLSSPRVHWFAGEDLAAEIAWLEAHPEYPHSFTPISGLPEADYDALLRPYMELARQRDRSAMRMANENNAWYATVTDEALAAVIAGRGPERPRIMLPVSSWSSVTQYAARDLVAAFETMGWEVSCLNLTWQLTPYRLISELHRFRPHVFLFINHLRTEALPCYPPGMMFVSWIQDSLHHINTPRAAQAWNEAVGLARERLAESSVSVAEGSAGPSTPVPQRRDLLIGYVGQLKSCGYAAQRLVELPMIVNPDLFRPVAPTPAQRELYACDVCFAANSGRPTPETLREIVVPSVREFLEGSALPAANDLTRWLEQLHDRLWRDYRAEQVYCDTASMEGLMAEEIPDFAALLYALSPDRRRLVADHLFWKMNDLIYRHVVVEWLAATGIRFHLYGHGWDRHPEFRRFARGPIKHGPDLSAAYQSATMALHLNALQHRHQRIDEILASGARLLTRYNPIAKPAVGQDLERAWKSLWQRAERLGFDHPDLLCMAESECDAPARRQLSDWLSQMAVALVREIGVSQCAPDRLSPLLARRIEAALANQLSVSLPDDETVFLFSNRAELEQQLRKGGVV